VVVSSLSFFPSRRQPPDRALGDRSLPGGGREAEFEVGQDVGDALDTDGEPDQPIGTKEEGELVRSFGLDYLHYGVGGTPLNGEGVEKVCDFLDHHGKVLVHCRKGSRAAALVLIHQARVNGWSSSEVAAKGKAMGLEIDGGLRTLVETYLDQHPPGGSKRAGGA